MTGALGIDINAHNFGLEWTDDVQAHLHGKAVQYVCLTESKTKTDHGDRSILARRDLPLEEFAQEFSGLAVWTGLDDAMLNSLLWIGANSHRSMDLPDTTGLSWREGKGSTQACCRLQLTHARRRLWPMQACRHSRSTQARRHLRQTKACRHSQPPQVKPTGSRPCAPLLQSTPLESKVTPINVFFWGGAYIHGRRPRIYPGQRPWPPETSDPLWPPGSHVLHWRPLERV